MIRYIQIQINCCYEGITQLCYLFYYLHARYSLVRLPLSLSLKVLVPNKKVNLTTLNKLLKSGDIYGCYCYIKKKRCVYCVYKRHFRGDPFYKCNKCLSPLSRSHHYNFVSHLGLLIVKYVQFSFFLTHEPAHDHNFSLPPSLVQLAQ